MLLSTCYCECSMFKRLASATVVQHTMYPKPSNLRGYHTIRFKCRPINHNSYSTKAGYYRFFSPEGRRRVLQGYQEVQEGLHLLRPQDGLVDRHCLAVHQNHPYPIYKEMHCLYNPQTVLLYNIYTCIILTSTGIL